MTELTRRSFIQTGAASALALSTLKRLPAQMLSAEGRAWRCHLPLGYLLVQQLSTYNASLYGAISTVAEAEQFFSTLKAAPEGKFVNGLEYQSLWFDANDMQAHEAIAQVGLAQNVDLWASTYQLATKIPAFGTIPPEFLSSFIQPNGQIVPTNVNQGAVFDVLNPEAMDWFLEMFREQYFRPMKGLLSGLFFNEDVLQYETSKPPNNVRFDYWENATYSTRVLSLWRDYCRDHEISYNGKLVDKFPVHDPAMVANGGGLTAYFPGWNVPAIIDAGQAFVTLPRAEGVWRHWYDFVCGQFLKNWIGRLAHLANDVNRNESIWKGVMYFGLHYWSLPYEEIENPQFKLDPIQEWGAWGRQRGVDLKELAAHKEVNIIVCETFPPVAANLDEFIGEWDRITERAHKTFGVMLDRDDSWALNLTEEQQRWAVIRKYQPTVIARYPLERMLPTDPLYNQECEEFIVEQLEQYRRGDT